MKPSQINNLHLPNDDERRKLFHWLKRISSYTAWKRILGYYEIWTLAIENCRKLASKLNKEHSSQISESHYIDVLKGLAHFEDAILRLKRGDKRVFKYDVNGLFSMADRPRSYWGNYLVRIEWREHPAVEEASTPGAMKFLDAFNDLSQAWGECSDILESEWLDDAAPLSFGNWLQDQLASMHFPSFLSDVPDPKVAALVSTGHTIPCFGIWEPVEVTKSGKFSLFKKKEEPKGPFPIIGCMNYLHAGSPAPAARYEDEDESYSEPVTWRLLWKDTRYEDGSIPAEEEEYVFQKPTGAKNNPAPPSGTDSPMIWFETGQPAPKAGRWLPEDDLSASIVVQAGEKFPMHRGRSTRWVFSSK
ncbi:Imm71 family immunity protein [Cupriavidus taiwanensis]|uniref:Imm71 family immunity protein n=1 Tax=Cupriavidus taiwanensis TaxID=164546 RepID=UPI000E102F78|nr:Imm71 family immunity protein [Cupriavidus taiwanensis]SOY61402.1 conserved hypothetical protein [Cupriavidus taiwanensis]SOY73911.1 conserved hypothetical protein [Cupriavidus taiwanensis]SOY97895.1 conserved hypothetical protein [Cupriavidus taiwanensis]SOZ67724.1 conserved hypothetical protein [Cupriavidus taiwanensis]SOZ84815.1 conserved hypothetical protein [Cupriavidus taiwanensis]